MQNRRKRQTGMHDASRRIQNDFSVLDRFFVLHRAVRQNGDRLPFQVFKPRNDRSFFPVIRRAAVHEKRFFGILRIFGQPRFHHFNVADALPVDFPANNQIKLVFFTVRGRQRRNAFHNPVFGLKSMPCGNGFLGFISQPRQLAVFQQAPDHGNGFLLKRHFFDSAERHVRRQSRHIPRRIIVGIDVILKSADFSAVMLNKQSRMTDFDGLNRFAAEAGMALNFHIQRQRRVPAGRRQRKVSPDRSDCQSPARRQPANIVDLVGRQLASVAVLRRNACVGGGW